MERVPVTTAAELAMLDDDEILEGYRDALSGEPEPGDNRSKAYWHGWSNGHADRTNNPQPAGFKLIKDCRREWGDDITKWGRGHHA